MSKWYALLLNALGPIDSSTILPLTPPVDTTTPLFSRTSRSLRPRQRTTTLMFVSSLPSSASGAVFRFGVRFFDDAILSVGDILPVNVGVAVCALFAPGRAGGGRMVDTFRVGPGGFIGTEVAIAGHACIGAAICTHAARAF